MDLNDPRIEAYLNQEMSEEDVQTFEREAKVNKAVWEHIQFQKFIIQGIRNEGATELKDFIANRMTEEVENDFTSRNIWWLVAASMIILAVGLGVTYKFPWLAGEENVMAKNEVNLGATNSSSEKSEPQLNTSKGFKLPMAEDTFINPEIVSAPENANIATAEALLNDDVSGSPLEDEIKVDMRSDVGFINIAAFVVSAIELNPVSQSKVTAAENIVAESMRKSKGKIEGKTRRDTTADYADKFRVAPTGNGDGIESNSNSSATFKKIKSEAPKQFLITLSEQLGIIKPQVFMGGQSEGKINLTIWNAGSVDILIFHLDEDYYIQLGNDFYYLPLILGSTVNLKPVSDRVILEKLK